MSINGIALFLALLLAACGTQVDVRPIVPAPEPIPVLDDCGNAEARLAELDCKGPGGEPMWQTPKGVSFGDACRAAAIDGRDWKPQCIATIETCDELVGAYRGETCR
ncbi:MAG: hypothetical protein ACYTBJ_22445 [Planctomycetota bacterium]|jgi:hypothetical protein